MCIRLRVSASSLKKKPTCRSQSPDQAAGQQSRGGPRQHAHPQMLDLSLCRQADSGLQPGVLAADAAEKILYNG